MISQKYTSLYIASTKKQLRKLNELLLAISKKPESVILVENLFRLIHSMKGAAATMSFKKTVELLHVLEDIVGAVYGRNLKFTKNILDLFFTTADVLQKNINSISQHGRQAPLGNQISRLKNCDRSDIMRPRKFKVNSLSHKKNIIDDLHIDTDIAVATDKLNNLQNLCDDLLINVMKVKSLAKKQGLVDILSVSVAADTSVNNLRRELEKLRVVPLSDIFSSLPYFVKDMAREQNKEIEVIVNDNNLSLDKTILDEITEILIQLLRNAVSHGIDVGQKNGRIEIEAAVVGDNMQVRVSDNGRGIDWKQAVVRAIKNKVITRAFGHNIKQTDLDKLIFMPGISVSKDVTFASGRGVGLSLVKDRVRVLDGKISVSTSPNKGTIFIITIPLPMYIIRALVIQLGHYQLALPLAHVKSIVSLETLESFSDSKFFTYKKIKYKLLDISQRMLLPSVNMLTKYVAILEINKQTFALPIASKVQERELVIKRTPQVLRRIPYIKGVGVVSDGRPVIILDISQIAK